MLANKKYRQGEIYLVKFHPASGKELRKFRPAIIMFDNVVDGLVTIAPLTSILKIRFPKLEFLLTPNTQNGLDTKSLILGWYLRTVDTDLVQKYLGKTTKVELDKIKSIFRALVR